MFSRKGDRIAKAQRESLVNAMIGGLALCLVGNQDDRHSAFTQVAADFLVQRRDPGTGINHEQCNIGANQ